MSRWGSYKAAPKKPPPADGIKVGKKAGSTWWGQRWIAALEDVLGADSGRLTRGRSYARAGRTHGLVIKGGKVSAKVTGSRSQPYQIVIEVDQLSDKVWQAAIAGMGEQAQFAAALLAGLMPEQIDEVFRAAGASLFPVQRTDLRTSCSCPDWGDPCKHVAATHYVLGEAIDQDPFLLFELRGRTRKAVTEALQLLRAPLRSPMTELAPAVGSEVAPAGKAGKRASKAKATKRPAKQPTPVSEQTVEPARDTSKVAIPASRIEQLSADEYQRAPQPLPVLEFHFDPAQKSGALLRQLGEPSVWPDPVSPEKLLTPLIQGAAAMARRIALAEIQEPNEGDGA